MAYATQRTQTYQDDGRPIFSCSYPNACLRKSQSIKNPGRYYWGVYHEFAGQWMFIRWADEEEPQCSQEIPFGAYQNQECLLRRCMKQPNFGRLFWVRVKKETPEWQFVDWAT